MRVLWTHNFPPEEPNSQVYMNTTAAGLIRRGVEPHCEYLGNLRSVRTLWRARRRVSSLAPSFDVIHAQYGSACALATSVADAPAKVVSIRGNDWTVHAEPGFHYVHSRLARLMTRRAIPRFDAVVTVSNRLAAEVRARWPDMRVQALPSPIDLDRFVPRDKADARARLGQPGDTRKWILFNALKLDDPIKRYPLALRAFEVATQTRNDLVLRVATNLPFTQVPLFVAACDLILCTSESEGWPNSVKEALACNIPFVSTDVSDLAAIAAREPMCRICPPEPAALGRGIVEVLGMLDGRDPVDARRYVSDMNLETTTTRLIELYQSLLARRGRDASRA
jgi:teichuronic acid biosynthesis glycosyltransferase TuaC